MIDSDLTLAHLSYGELFDSGSATTPCYSPAIFVTLRSPMTISRGSRSRRCWRAMSRRFGPATAIAFSSSPVRSDRSPGSRATRTSLEILSTASCFPALAMWAAYKQSRRGNAAIDRIVAHVLRHDEAPHRITPFVPYGYDERQYCSPGFNLPVGCLMRTSNGEYAEYRSPADNLSLLRSQSLAHSLSVSRRIVAVIEGNAVRKGSRSSAGAGSMRRWADSAPRATTKWHCCGS